MGRLKRRVDSDATASKGEQSGDEIDVMIVPADRL
jgi:hypothetical protein